MTLPEARIAMDRINQRMLDLFIERMEVSQSIARIKQAAGLPVYDQSREQAILDAVTGQTPDALKPYAAALFETLFAPSRTYQEQLGTDVD